jgi:hypothetical protein
MLDYREFRDVNIYKCLYLQVAGEGDRYRWKRRKWVKGEAIGPVGRRL